MKHASAIELIQSVKSLRVCVAGDTIIDEYRPCVALNKSPKENLIPVKCETSEVFMGGVHAAANHVRTFCAQVEVLSTGPITRKVRFVELPYWRKVFEYHTTEETARYGVPVIDHDVLIVTDFGHGEFTKDARERVCSQPCFVAVNAQTNSANLGYNLITNYRRADYIVIDEPEARLAAHDRDSPIEAIIEKLAEGRCGKFVVTRGTEGAVGYDGTRFARHRAFTSRVLDTMGAGDAFFAVTAPMAMYGSLEDLLLIGNAAGAMKCQIYGHRQSVTKSGLIQFLESL